MAKYRTTQIIAFRSVTESYNNIECKMIYNIIIAFRSVTESYNKPPCRARTERIIAFRSVTESYNKKVTGKAAAEL